MITIKIPYDPQLFNSFNIMAGTSLNINAKCTLILSIDEVAKTCMVSVYAGETEAYKNGFYINQDKLSLFTRQ